MDVGLQLHWEGSLGVGHQGVVGGGSGSWRRLVGVEASVKWAGYLGMVWVHGGRMLGFELFGEDPPSHSLSHGCPRAYKLTSCLCV